MHDPAVNPIENHIAIRITTMTVATMMDTKIESVGPVKAPTQK